VTPSPARATFRSDLLRNAAGGYVDSCERTLFLLIALRSLHADSWAKSLIAGAVGIGYLFTPWMTQMVRRSRRPVTVPASWLLVGAAAATSVPLVVPGVFVYVIGVTVGLALSGTAVPLLTSVFMRNYAPGRRGRNVSLAITVRVAMMAMLAPLAGRHLEQHRAAWKVLLVAASAAYLVQALAISRMPSGALAVDADDAPNERVAWKRRMELMRADPLLRSVLVSWMFMGFANLMMLPLRVEYVANPRYGINLPSAKVAVITSTIPALVRLTLTVPFGWAFDRMPFFATRVLVNLAFASSIVAFFLGASWTGLVIGALLFGVAVAGGDVLWNLWVTKFAPTGKVADYMSLHTFFTGVRGLLAPIVGFQLIGRVSVVSMGWVCAALITVASVVLVPHWRAERAERSSRSAGPVLLEGQPVVQDLS
jgi:MFS family permease